MVEWSSGQVISGSEVVVVVAVAVMLRRWWRLVALASAAAAGGGGSLFKEEEAPQIESPRVLVGLFVEGHVAPCSTTYAIYRVSCLSGSKLNLLNPKP